MTISFTRRVALALTAAALASPLATLASAADSDWPTKPLHVFVGFPAGSSPDLLARIVTEPLAQRLGQPVIIENKPGAGGVIGVQQMLAANDPGYAFGTTINGPLTTAPRLIDDLSYDVAEDIAPVALMASSPLVLAVSDDFAADDLAGFVDAASADPGALAYGSVGQGSGSHLTAELFSLDAGVEMLHIPFTSYAEVTTSIIGGEIDGGFMAPSAAKGHVDAGNMKILGVTSLEPFGQIPDVPAMAGQAGLPDEFRAELWNAFIAPAGTAPEILERLNAEVAEILADPEVQQKMLDMGWKAEGGSPDDLAERITADTGTWGKVLDRLED